MKKLTMAAVLGLGFISNAYSYNAPKSKAEFCGDHESSVERTQEVLRNMDMRMSFRNKGGLANGGVCWWHSRFQRNAAYLTIYRPELPRPTRSEAKEIIKDIRFAKGVITIPGFSDFSEFSAVYHDEIQSRLNGWQRTDGMILQQWVVGLAGASDTTPEKMKKIMEDTYEQVSGGDVVYQKLQIKGIVAHAWLVIGMAKTSNGYELEVIDSNSPRRTSRYTYREGDTSFYHSWYGKFVPYTGKNRELRKLKKRVKKFCK